ncbi:MAG: hypothetical protein V1904_08910 [Bacteroidota bacterium]
MKTKIIIKKLIINFFMIILSALSHAQQPVLVKTLSVTLYAAEKYETSKQLLYDMIDSTGSTISSVSESKTDNESQTTSLIISASEKAFWVIDKNLSSLGYISSKTLKSEDKSAVLDTSALSREIEFLKKQKLQNETLLETLVKGSDLYVEVWKKISETEEKIFAEEKLITNAAFDLSKPHKIIVTINY